MQRTTDLTRRREELDKSPDIDLQMLWDKAKADFVKQTGYNLDDLIPIGNIQEKIEKVDAMQIPDEDETDEPESDGSSKKVIIKDAFQRAKNLFAKVFKVIWSFSEFFLPAAGKIPIVGAGVEFLAKAIDLLIQTTRNYREIFLKAAQLFEQVGFFSMRFEMLMEAENAGAQLHPKYRQFLHRIMAHTVGCVALYIKLTHKATDKAKADDESRRQKFKRRLKHATNVTVQFFNTMATGDDAGVGAHMDDLRNLVEEEGRLSTALILASVLKIHKDVGAVQSSVNTVSDKLSLVHNMITEYSTSLSPSRVDQLKALFCITHEPWNDAFRACAERCVAGTGAWLFQHDSFTAWTATRNDTPHIFALEAGSNFGKTYLATIAITYLHERALEMNAHSIIAFYYFNKASKDLTAAAVVRAIAYQLCTQNSRFFDLAHPLIKNIVGTNSNVSSSLAIDLWTSLIVEVSSQLADLSFFVIFDGLELLADEQLQILSKALASSKRANQGLRILLTGNASSLESVSHYAGDSFSKIALNSGYPNRSDITLVTEAELARCDYFSDGLDSPELLECMASIRNLLVQAVGGDYYLLQSQVREIRHLSSMGEINRVLSRADNDREATIKRHLSNLVIRVSDTELLKLRNALHLLAVLDILGAPMPHIAVLEQYLASGRASAATRTKILSAYSGLISTDAQGRLSLATDEITTFLLPILDTSQTIVSPTQKFRDKQLDAIKQFLNATFNPTTLKEHGIDDEFFESRSRLSSLSNFTVERNLAMAKVAIRFIDCLSEISTTQREQSTRKNQPWHSISVFVREVLPKLILHMDTSQLDDDLRTDLGTEITRLFFEDAMFDVFWPVEALSQAVTTWGKNDQYFDAVYDIIKHPNVIQRLERQQRGQSWATELQKMSNASDLKVAASKMIAKRWLLSKSFWAYDEMPVFFLWFSTLPALGLMNENVVEVPYDKTRTIGWFTPPNWRKIEAWVMKNVQIDDRASLDIQKAAVLLAFGGKSKTPAELLEPYSGADWRANVWLAEAMSLHDHYNAAFNAVEQCLGMLVEFDVDQATMIKVNDCFLDWMGHWDDASRAMQIRERMIKLNELKPGILSMRMWADTLVAVFRAKGWDAAFDFFQAQYQSRKQTVLETFVRQASHNYLHIALSRTLANDPEGSRLRFLHSVYEEAIALCDNKEMISPKDMYTARVRLAFWLGRLFFISKDPARLSEAIARWEGLLKDFLFKPSTRDLDILLPIIIHLCSAYLQALPQEHAALKADHIISQVTKLHEVTRFSQKPIALKLYFRVSLCLARIYVVRGEAAKAHEILQEHADAAFAMLSQRNNEPLFSIGWLYLASILTVLDQDDVREKWAWSKTRISTPRPATAATTPLDAAVKQKIEAIKSGEEYTFFDGIFRNQVAAMWVDDLYLPSFATMACDGRNCRATAMDMSDQPTNLDSEPLQIAAGITFRAKWPPAQKYRPHERIAFRVCRDCVLSKMCVTCYSRLEKGYLPPMGCSLDHSALIVPASYNDKKDTKSNEAIPYQVSDKDMEIVTEESKKWNINF
ncbi:hypothetical protein H2199_008771 [Coniosporium tulheliwenetii]|uniref:Uncharacterized protein n=1 Tax=Coniosporium tulheliwenetii TaxID=3383036 RepID=A0ACC2YII5_9PEZI|nr:hypothetical protein H2199_008771 [Cladosporium sp. JES 115]